MLSKFGMENMELIKLTLKETWGENSVITDIKIINRPFDMFEMYVLINKQHNIMLSYDRSIVDISVKQNDKYTWLTDLTDKKVIEGFESCKQENLLYNFSILDKVLNAL